MIHLNLMLIILIIIFKGRVVVSKVRRGIFTEVLHRSSLFGYPLSFFWFCLFVFPKKSPVFLREP
jgi:hypothetical protein